MIKVIVKTGDNLEVRIDKDLAMNMSPKIRNKVREALEGYEHEAERDVPIPLPLITAATLKLVVEWADFRKDKPVYDGQGNFYIREKELHTWDPWEQKYVQRYKSSLDDLRKAAWYLRMKPLWIAMRIALNPKDSYFWHTYVARYNVTAEWDEENVQYT